jgi:ketosteroid isomerase-like protein
MTDSHTPTALAEAFTGHDFNVAYDHLAEDIVWENIGGETYEGSAAVRSACAAALEYFKTIETTFKRLEAAGDDTHVTVQSLADYTEADGTVSTVASCDVYTFTDGKINLIRSYNIELG